MPTTDLRAMVLARSHLPLQQKGGRKNKLHAGHSASPQILTDIREQQEQQQCAQCLLKSRPNPEKYKTRWK